MNHPTPTKGSRPWGLVLWTALACVGFAIAPSPPPVPATSEEEIAAVQRGLDRIVEAARRWQAERGDLRVPWAEANGHLAIVIDDVGRELHLFEQLLDLRFALTFSVLPGSVYAAGAQLRLQADRRRPREIFLHLPMEPDDTAQMTKGLEATEDFLRAGDSPQTLVAKLEAALARVPEAIGVNNHMGSRLTPDCAAMAAIMPTLRERGLVFLDSRTTASTCAEQSARAAGVPTLARQIFLDDDPSSAAIEAQLERAAALARTRPVVAIGHPSPEMVEVLLRRLPELHAQGVAVYPASELLHHEAAGSGGGVSPATPATDERNTGR
jgi:polysaccharide deacetylase 2 family uncharacterized protein YibQ